MKKLLMLFIYLIFVSTSTFSTDDINVLSKEYEVSLPIEYNGGPTLITSDVYIVLDIKANVAIIDVTCNHVGDNIIKSSDSYIKSDILTKHKLDDDDTVSFIKILNKTVSENLTINRTHIRYIILISSYKN